MTLAGKHTLEEANRSTFERVCVTFTRTNKVLKGPHATEEAFEVEWIFIKPSRHLWYILTSPLLKSIMKCKLTLIIHIASLIVHDSSVQFYSKEKVFVLFFFLTFSKITFLLYAISSPLLNTYTHFLIQYPVSHQCYFSVVNVLHFELVLILNFFSFHFSGHGIKIKNKNLFTGILFRQICILWCIITRFSKNILINAESWYYHYRKPWIVIISYLDVPCDSHP